VVLAGEEIGDEMARPNLDLADGLELLARQHDGEDRRGYRVKGLGVRALPPLTP
jgi:hypothetical protein